MGITAVILGLVGGLCAVTGIVTAAGAIPPVMPEFTWTFWFFLAALFLLGAIAFATGRGELE
jgi:hypothetical protein